MFESNDDNKLAEIARDPSSIEAMPREVARAVWLEASALAARLMTRWASPFDATEEMVLTVPEAAEFAKISQSFLYEHWQHMKSAFTAGKAVRFRKASLIADIAAIRDRADIEPIPNRRASTPRAGRRLRAGGMS